MRFFDRNPRSAEAGQASVELLAALPIALFVLTAGWQVVATGHAWWTLSESARVAARTAYVKSEGERSRLGAADVRLATDRAAADVLPQKMRGGHRTVLRKTGAVVVTARVPLAGPLAAVIHRGPTISARSAIAR